MNQRRVILHIDMNSFYASVESAKNPSLKGKPLAIAGNPLERRGIILTSSYEAREQGVRTTMPLWEAKKKCPSLLVLPPNFPLYRDISIKMFHILQQYSPLVEPVSIDEGYVDVTNHEGHPVILAKEIQNKLIQQLDLPSSIGIAPNKFLAKMASNMKKPMGITILRKRDIAQKIWPLQVEEMYGIGKKTADKLNKINIRSIADLAEGDLDQLKRVLGINGARLKERANGIDRSPVDPEAYFERKSIGNSTTLPKDCDNQKDLEDVLYKLSRKVSERLIRQQLVGYTVQLTIRYSNRETITRNKKQDNPIVLLEELFQAVKMLLKRHWNGEAVRLLGVAVHDVEEKRNSSLQLNLFSFKEEVKDDSIQQAIDLLSQKYGKKIVQKGLISPENDEGTSFEKDFLTDWKNYDS